MLLFINHSKRRQKSNVKVENHTEVAQFFLLGLSDDPELQPLLCELFLSMCLVTVLGNLLIILAVSSDIRLHIPMYFFLFNLSFMEICFTSTTVPKILVNIQAQNKVMAYDRFVAICHPLRYTFIINPRLCGLLVLMSWIIMLCVSLIHILLMMGLIFSTSTEIPHFFCELAQLLKVARSDTLINNIFLYVTTVLIAVFPVFGIIFSYSQIASSLLRMSSTASRYKAFSTCGYQLCVVLLFYGTGLGVYLSSAGTHSLHESCVVSVMYTVVSPTLNPFIYSLRNKDVKGGLRRLLSRVTHGSLGTTDLRTKGMLQTLRLKV
ncbi:Olfactory receptor 867 [Heterocephalus glaber]|uniref:Olfactory receptor 867 n=1 Tax=Heterocephalus glaber TaxID=10181 RepID=G5AJX6_HETGA|nr:Olfactory receptor 867 [Heterocephalus glaber]